MLQPKESIDIVCLVQNYKNLHVGARILDVKEIPDEELDIDVLNKQIMISQLGMLTLGLAVVLILAHQLWLGAILTVIGYLLEIPARRLKKRHR
jgi:hypothetical protein